jgi:hypothetical protein
VDVVVEGVSQVWGSEQTRVVALDRISHRFRSGTFSCLLGPSGVLGEDLKEVWMFVGISCGCVEFFDPLQVGHGEAL